MYCASPLVALLNSVLMRLLLKYGCEGWLTTRLRASHSLSSDGSARRGPRPLRPRLRNRTASSGKQTTKVPQVSSAAPHRRISGCFQDVSRLPLFSIRTTKPIVAKMGALCADQYVISKGRSRVSEDCTHHSPKVNANTTRVCFSLSI